MKVWYIMKVTRCSMLVLNSFVQIEVFLTSWVSASADATVYDQFIEVLKECNLNKDLLLMGDFSVNNEVK